MVSVNIKGALGKLGYTDIPDEIVDDMLKAIVDKAFIVAKQKAPYDTDPNQVDPRHIRDELKKYYSKSLRAGAVWVELPYAHAAEYGTKSRLMHPFIRPAAAAGRALAKAIARSAIKLAIKKAKEKAGK